MIHSAFRNLSLTLPWQGRVTLGFGANYKYYNQLTEVEMNPTVIRGQKVNRVKLQRAKELRQAMTPAEKLLWGQLHANRLGGFLLNQKEHHSVKQGTQTGLEIIDPPAPV